MTKREKLLERMRNSPGNIRFGEVESLLKAEGYVLFNQRGSHCVYHHPSGALLTIARPHGGRKACHPRDILKLLEVLGR